MAPIVAPTASSEEDELNFGHGAAVFKAKLGGVRHGVDYPVSPSDRRDDDVTQPEGEEASNLFGESNDADKRQSKLFAEETNPPADLYLGNEDKLLQSIDTTAMPQTSLMQSSPPSPSSPLGLEDVDIGSDTGAADTQSQVFDDFAVAIMSQIDADEALAKQLQEEEDKKRMVAPKEKPRPRVVPTMLDSILGEPSPYELRNGNYARVEKESSNSSSESASDFPDSVSSGISMMTKSFMSWGNSMTAAATDFFGEDIAMQRRTSTSPITRAATDFFGEDIAMQKRGSVSQYRNEV